MEWLNMDCGVAVEGGARAVSEAVLGPGNGATYDKARSNSILAAECRASSSTNKASPSSSCVVVVVVVVMEDEDDEDEDDGDVDGARWLQN